MWDHQHTQLQLLNGFSKYNQLFSPMNMYILKFGYWPLVIQRATYIINCHKDYLWWFISFNRSTNSFGVWRKLKIYKRCFNYVFPIDTNPSTNPYRTRQFNKKKNIRDARWMDVTINQYNYVLLCRSQTFLIVFECSINEIDRSLSVSSLWGRSTFRLILTIIPSSYPLVSSTWNRASGAYVFV